MAAQYVQARIHRGSVPFLPQQIGHWWGTDSATKKQVEIDLVAMADIQANPNARPVCHLLVGECKWKNEPVGQDVLVSLMEKPVYYTVNHTIGYLANEGLDLSQTMNG